MRWTMEQMIEENCQCETETAVCREYQEMLKRDLTGKQKALFQQFTDEKDCLIAQAAKENYLAGLLAGLELLGMVDRKEE